jgi:hypothetical protein
MPADGIESATKKKGNDEEYDQLARARTNAYLNSSRAISCSKAKLQLWCSTVTILN